MLSLLSSVLAAVKKVVVVAVKVCLAFVQWLAVDVLHTKDLVARLTAAVKG